MIPQPPSGSYPGLPPPEASGVECGELQFPLFGAGGNNLPLPRLASLWPHCSHQDSVASEAVPPHPRDTVLSSLSLSPAASCPSQRYSHTPLVHKAFHKPFSTSCSQDSIQQRAFEKEKEKFSFVWEPAVILTKESILLCRCT